MSDSTTKTSTSADLLERARSGDQQAWQVLFDDCYPKIVRVVSRRMSRPLRSLYDSTDIANEVMNSLAVKFAEFDFESITGMRKYLIKAAERKVADGYRRGHAMKRDVNRIQPSYPGDDLGQLEVVDRCPTPSQIAVASESKATLLEDRSDEERLVLEMRAEGFSNNEVARETGWHLRKVERFLERLRGTCRL